MRVALALDQPDWHASVLRAAANARNIDLVPLRLADCAFDSTRPDGLSLPGLDGARPAAMLVRAIGGGSFEEVTRRLGVLHALRELGVAVWNDARAIERCTDKSTTAFLLARAGLATPETWALEGLAAASAVVEREAPRGALVCKPLFGAQGRGLRLVATPDELPPPATIGGVYFLQRYVQPGPSGFHDHRLFVVAGEVVGSMTRRGKSWITNLRQGGRAESFEPPGDLVDLATAATACVGADYAGVDLMRDRDGEPWVIEVNSMPGWRGLQGVARAPIADLLLAALLDRCNRR